MADRVYLKCSAKARETSFGEVINVGIKVTDLAEFCRAHKNERGYLNLTISPRREVGQYGDTHAITLDTYTPRTGSGAMQDAGRREGRSRHQDDGAPF